MRFRTLLPAALALAAGSAAHGAVTFKYVTDSVWYGVTPNGTVGVNVYLQETVTAPSTSKLVAENGIYGFDVRMQRVSGNALITGASANTAIFSQPLSPTYSPSLAQMASGVTQADMIMSALDMVGPTGASTGGKILLGTFFIKGDASGSSTFSVMDDPDFTSTVTNASEVSALDGAIAAQPRISTLSFTIVAVPEPATVGLLAAGGLLLLRRRSARIARPDRV
jgi:hypothetical protein